MAPGRGGGRFSTQSLRKRGGVSPTRGEGGVGWEGCWRCVFGNFAGWRKTPFLFFFGAEMPTLGFLAFCQGNSAHSLLFLDCRDNALRGSAAVCDSNPPRPMLGTDSIPFFQSFLGHFNPISGRGPLCYFSANLSHFFCFRPFPFYTQERESLRPFSPPQEGVSDPFSHRKRGNPVHPQSPFATNPLVQRIVFFAEKMGSTEERFRWWIWSSWFL